MFPEVRMRRLRRTQNIRNMVQEVQLNMNDYIYPIFVIEGQDIKNEIPSMPGIYQFSLDHLLEEVQRAVDVGVIAIMLFGIPAKKNVARRPTTTMASSSRQCAWCALIIRSW